jgi:hypothetical protein
LNAAGLPRREKENRGHINAHLCFLSPAM